MKVQSLFRNFVPARLHHSAAFTLVAMRATERVPVRLGVDTATIKRLGRIDHAFGVAAVAVLIAGFARAVYGLKVPVYYLGKWVFWLKIGIFAFIGFLSIRPRLRILACGRRVKLDPQALPAREDILQVKRLIHIETALVLLLPIFAAAVARGYGSP